MTWYYLDVIFDVGFQSDRSSDPQMPHLCEHVAASYDFANSNAYTSMTQTVYHAIDNDEVITPQEMSDKIAKSLSILYDTSQRDKLEKAIKKETERIRLELLDYEDVFWFLPETLYGKKEFPILMQIVDFDNITSDVIYKYVKENYGQPKINCRYFDDEKEISDIKFNWPSMKKRVRPKRLLPPL